MKRRALLARVGTVAVAGAFAGCVDGTGSDDGDGDDPGSGADGDGDEETMEPADDGNGDGGDDDGNGDGTDEDQDDTDDQTNSGGDDDNDDEGTETDPVADTAISTLEAECGSTSEATIEFDLEGETRTATITGFVRAPNPCHEAVLVGTVAENGMVTVTVGVESDGEDICMECTGHVEYEATITFGEQLPDVLAVDHDYLEETIAVTRRELDEQ